MSCKFRKLPGGYGQVKIQGQENVYPLDIYNYAVAFRKIYTRSAPILKPIADKVWGATHDGSVQFYDGSAQALATQIAFSDELMMKAIILGSTGELGETTKIHSLKSLFSDFLDERYQKIIISYLEKNGLSQGKLEDVLDTSSRIFIDARYGFDKKDEYTLDFITLQLLNEVLCKIFTRYVPDWTMMTKSQQRDVDFIKQKTDSILSPNKMDLLKRKLWRALEHEFRE